MSLEYAKGYLKGIEDSSWNCIDCGNAYESSVEECPNRLMDEANAKVRYEKHRIDSE